MTQFVLRRTDQGGGWVAPPGSPKSYTHNKAKARRFSSEEEAEADRCPDNEVIEPA
jgi:hypothetical protein